MAEKSTFRPVRWLDSGMIFLMLTLLILLCGRLAATGWVENLFMLQNILPFACVLGIWVGYSQFRFRWVLVIGLLYGAVAIFWLLGSVFQPDGTWLFRLDMIFQRMAFSMKYIQADRALTDPILFYTGAVCVIWSIAYAGGYSLVRRGVVWVIIIPALLLYLVVDWFDIYYQNRSIIGLVFSLAIILLIARMNLLHQRRGWQNTGSENQVSAEKDLIRITILLAMGIGVGISLIPGAGVRYVPEQIVWNESDTDWANMRKAFANLFAPLKSDSNFSLSYYSDEFSLGTNANQSAAPAFEVRVNPLPDDGERFFWRVRTYDTYKLGTWSSSAVPVEVLDGSVPPQPDWSGSKLRSFKVKVLTSSLKSLYTERDPSDFDLSPEIYLHPEITGFADLDRSVVNPPIYAGAEYSFVSPMLHVEEKKLILSRADDPPGIQELYLQLPPEITSRVRQLAMELTKGKSSRYERAMAITNYLRATMKYQVSVDATPFGQDPVDYFVFDAKVGFCNYYASSAVVMMRAAGIPARMVVGFSQGDLDENENVYTVRMQNSHAWAEVFFPEYGWVPFEATSSQPEYRIPSPLAESVIETTPTPQTAQVPEPQITPIQTPRVREPREFNEDFGQGISNARPVTEVFVSWIILAGGLVVLFFVWLALDSRVTIWLIRVGIKSKLHLSFASNWLKNLNLTSRLDQALVLPEIALWLGGIHSPEGLTPRERILRWQDYLPEYAQDISSFIADYEKAIFSRDTTSDKDMLARSKKIYRKLLPGMVARRLGFRR